LDNGTGFTKMGYSGNSEPSFIVPSIISTVVEKQGATVQDLDFFIGADAVQKRADYNTDYPIREGIVSNWDNMEKYWQRCIFQYLCADPEEHNFMLTEPPMNTPENRELTAEIMFETFNVPGLIIAVQAVCALYGSLQTGQRADEDGSDMPITGTVIDSGDGVTHVIPVAEGYPIGSCIKHIPLAGRTITEFILQMMRDRGETLPPDQALEIAQKVKETYCYVCPDLVKEYQKFDTTPDSRFRQYKGTDLKTKKKFNVDVGYERFLGPELFFNPEIFSNEFSTSLPDLVDSTIQACPIDTRLPLYNYITLSGGSTMYKHFSRRLQRDIQRKVTEREEIRAKKYPDLAATMKKTEVNVATPPFQRFAVWFGASMLAICPGQTWKTRAEYQEKGPGIMRANAVLSSVNG